jgi:hypothetical protein
MITPEELEYLDENTKQKILKELQEAQQVKGELQDFFKKAYSNPQAKQKLTEALHAIDPNLQIPNSPIENYTSGIEAELNRMKEQMYQEKMSREAQAVAAKYGIAPEEGKAIDEFMLNNRIIDPIKGIELYGKLKQTTIHESTNRDVVYDTLTGNQTVDLNEATQNAVRQLKVLRGY